jgi:hypothetical protein
VRYGREGGKLRLERLVQVNKGALVAHLVAVVGRRKNCMCVCVCVRVCARGSGIGGF